MFVCIVAHNGASGGCNKAGGSPVTLLVPRLCEVLGSDVVAEPEDVEMLQDATAEYLAHDALIVRTPTWNAGVDSEERGTDCDAIYYDKVPALKEALKAWKCPSFGW
jgi:hypothetical protein